MSFFVKKMTTLLEFSGIKNYMFITAQINNDYFTGEITSKSFYGEPL